jgi:uncharacterized membrane protein
MPKTSAKPGSRLAFLDWTRGFAALIMLQGHVTHSFMRNDLRQEGPYQLSQFIGGITPAVFLFLTGVTLAFLMDSSAKKGLTAGARAWAAFRRSGFLISMAILFRLQMFLFGWGHTHWTNIFKVDILNAMALGVATLAPLAIFETRDRVRFGLISGIAIASAGPIISGADWSWLHPFVRSYFVPDHFQFPYFPWAAFIAFGVSAGSVIRLLQEEHYHRMMQWASLFGLALIMIAGFFSSMPYSLYPNSDFWLNSPALIFIKLGVILLIASVAFLWTRHINPYGWSFVRQLGTTSLLVYWVHTEIVYGRWLWFLKESLTAPQAFLAAFAVICSMIGLSVLRTGWKDRPGLPVALRQRWNAWRADLVAEPAAGD